MRLPGLRKRESNGDSKLDPSTIPVEAAKLQWYHCLRLTPEYTTPGRSGFSLEMPQLPWLAECRTRPRLSKPDVLIAQKASHLALGPRRISDRCWT